MREALARSNHDFVVSEPARPGKAATRRGLRASFGTIARIAYRLAAYPNRVGAGLLVGLAIAIMVNALMLQGSRHPAPLFRRNIIVPIQAVPTHEKPKAAAEPAAQPRDPISQLLKTEPTASRPRAAVADVRASSRDPISQLLKVVPTPPTPPAQLEEQPKTVFAVQKALVKLGFVLRADGHMGMVTRHALEQYERDNGLPPRVELTPRLLHRLAAESGIKLR